MGQPWWETVSEGSLGSCREGAGVAEGLRRLRVLTQVLICASGRARGPDLGTSPDLPGGTKDLEILTCTPREAFRVFGPN